MSYSFSPSDHHLLSGCQRITEAQIDAALGDLCNPALTLDQKTYTIRRRSKKIRALLKLVRPGFAGYREENIYLRDVSRSFGDARDAVVMITLFEQMAKDDAAYLPPDLRISVQQALINRRQAISDRDLAAHLQQAEDMLRALKKRSTHWSFALPDEHILEEGTSMTLARATSMMASAAETGEAEDFHEWRKWAKYHRMQLRLLKKIWPQEIEPRLIKVTALAQILGAHHDLFVLAEMLRAQLGRSAAPGFTEEAVPERLKRLEHEGLKLGEEIFREDPHQFGKRGAGYWALALEKGLYPAAAQR